MGTALKQKRIELRVTVAQKEAIEAAAAIEGRTVTDFSTSVLAAHAAQVIDRDRRVQVDAIQHDAFLVIMDRPAQDLEGLRELFARDTVFVD